MLRSQKSGSDSTSGKIVPRHLNTNEICSSFGSYAIVMLPRACRAELVGSTQLRSALWVDVRWMQNRGSHPALREGRALRIPHLGDSICSCRNI